MKQHQDKGAGTPASNEDTTTVIVSANAMQFADSHIPEFKKVAGLNYIPFGEGNIYPDYLEMLYKKSSKHAAIINNKVVYIMGNGFKDTDPNIKAFLAKANPNKSWYAVTKNMCRDIEKKGGTYLEIIPKNGGGYNVYNIKYDRMRTNEDNSKFWYKKDWSKIWNTTGLKEYPAFYNGIKTKSIYYYKECEDDVYALPGWVAACNWIESDIEVSKCTLTNAKTGFSASKFINFFNGEPDEAKKKSIQRRMENTATGSQGKKILIGFNNDPAKAPKVDDLGQSDLTKEDFSQVNNLITDNMYAGHGVTHPLLFGIQQAGKLGNSAELKLAFDIFKNTYANAKQKSIEGLVAKFAAIAGVPGEIKLQDIEPVGLEFTEATLLEIAPLDWLREKLGIDATQYPGPPAKAGTGTPAGPGAGPGEESMVNSTLTNLTGKQHQQLARIVRKYGQGKLTKEQALLELKNGFGFTEEDAKTYLGINDDAFNADDEYTEEAVAFMFTEIGEAREDFDIVEFATYEEGDAAMQLVFAAGEKLTDLQAKILAVIKKDSKATNEAIATSLDVPVEQIDAAVKALVKAKNLEVAEDGTRKVLVAKPTKALPEVLVRYSYEKRTIAEGADVIATTRPFCKKLIELNRFYTREEIQKISERLGYSVFKRAGGFWKRPDGVTDFKCRHEWRQNIVIKKK